MILGLSHIAISTDDIATASNRLASFGYEPRFDEPTLENHVAKAPLLTKYQPCHHIRSFAAKGAMAVELLDHGELCGQQVDAMIPVFRTAVPPQDWQRRTRASFPIDRSGWEMLERALGEGTSPVYDPALSMRLIWMPCDAEEPQGLFACVIPSTDLTTTETLLSQLRFRADDAGMWSLLTPLPTLQARVIPVSSTPHDGWSSTPKLDSPGSACIALMARKTDQELLPPALRKKATSFTLTLDKKLSYITLAWPGHGPIVELVDQPK